jgi:hypothetical protein
LDVKTARAHSSHRCSSGTHFCNKLHFLDHEADDHDFRFSNAARRKLIFLELIRWMAVGVITDRPQADGHTLKALRAAKKILAGQRSEA